MIEELQSKYEHLQDVNISELLKIGIEKHHLTEKQSVMAVRVVLGVISKNYEPTSKLERQELQREDIKEFMQHVADQIRPDQNRIFIL